MTPGVTVAVPTIPPRVDNYLAVALRSVFTQTYPITAVSVAVDVERRGAWATRQRALEAVRTEWVAFLDDDDEFYPNHIATLVDCAGDSGADYVYSYYDTTRTADIPHAFGEPFRPGTPPDRHDMTHTTMTIMVRTELALAVGFTPREPHHTVGGEDWRFTIGCVDKGATIVHAPHQTWYWRHHGANTSGREDRW